jgi:hypothetical protein
VDDIIRRAKALLKLEKQQRKWWLDRCDVAEAGDPFKERIEVLQALIERCDAKGRAKAASK